MAHDSSIKSDCKSSLTSKKRDDNCWGQTDSSSCDIKSTAIAIIALDYAGEDVDDYIEWLLSKRKSASELTWFLEIDANNETECTINSQAITIEENKKISGSNPSGLKKAYGNYWFEITDISKNFTISCENDFITTLLYKKTGSSIYYVSSETHAASAHDSTEERVEAYCFSTSANCDYEGSLWATLALSRAGEDITTYLPYLPAMSSEEENRKYLPYAFLQMFSPGDDYYSTLIEQQKQGKYWEESGNKYYDTAIALIALSGINVDGVTSSIEYMISIQESSGCWKSDTSLLIYALWPRQASTDQGKSTRSRCTEYNHYCVAPSECSLESQLDNFYCEGLSQVCCLEATPAELSCSEKQGIICNSGYECDGTEVISSDTNYCCIGECKEEVTTNECEDAGYFCRDQCSEGSQEEKTAYSNSCEFGMKCCGDKIKSGSNWWIILLLIILIILVILAIIFRDRIKTFWYNRKNQKNRKTTAPPGRPTPPGFMRPMPRQGPPSRIPLRRPMTRTDKDFDETMKKLRDMSK
jgi:hypothetical protein